jgi:DNA-binding NarL/FixJ family response regulator
MAATSTMPASGAAPHAPASVAIVGSDAELTDRIGEALEQEEMPSVRARTVNDLSSAPPVRGLDVLLLAVSGDEAALSEAVNAARAEFPGVPLVAVWDGSEEADERRALRLGVQGVVPGDKLDLMLVATVQAVSVGLVCVPRGLRDAFTRENLSSREKQILGMLVMGFTNAEIAARLFLAESTVKSHLSTAYEKLGVRSRKDAAALILDPAVGLDRGILMISAA